MFKPACDLRGDGESARGIICDDERGKLCLCACDIKGKRFTAINDDIKLVICDGDKA